MERRRKASRGHPGCAVNCARTANAHLGRIRYIGGWNGIYSGIRHRQNYFLTLKLGSGMDVQVRQGTSGLSAGTRLESAGETHVGSASPTLLRAALSWQLPLISANPVI